METVTDFIFGAPKSLQMVITAMKLKDACFLDTGYILSAAPPSGAATRGVTPRPRPGVAGGRSYPMPLSPRPGAVGGRSNPTTEARGGGREDQPHVQGAMAAQAQEGLEELSHLKIK